MDEELLLVFGIGLVALAWFLVGPVLCIVLFRKVMRLEDDVARIKREGLGAAAPRPARRRTAPQEPAGETEEIWLDDDQFLPEKEPSRPVAKHAPPAAKSPAARPSAKPVPETAAEEPGQRWSVEELFGGQWLTWVGALLVVIAAGLAFKYTIDTELIGPTGRLVIGLLVGVGCFAGGAFAMARDYRFLSQGLVAAAMGILLNEGIGDTIRVSLTPRPGGDRRDEVYAACELLQAMNLRAFSPSITACPASHHIRRRIEHGASVE